MHFDISEVVVASLLIINLILPKRILRLSVPFSLVAVGVYLQFYSQSYLSLVPLVSGFFLAFTSEHQSKGIRIAPIIETKSIAIISFLSVILFLGCLYFLSFGVRSAEIKVQSFVEGILIVLIILFSYFQTRRAK